MISIVQACGAGIIVMFCGLLLGFALRDWMAVNVDAGEGDNMSLGVGKFKLFMVKPNGEEVEIGQVTEMQIKPDQEHLPAINSLKGIQATGTLKNSTFNKKNMERLIRGKNKTKRRYINLEKAKRMKHNGM